MALPLSASKGESCCNYPHKQKARVAPRGRSTINQLKPIINLVPYELYSLLSASLPSSQWGDDFIKTFSAKFDIEHRQNSQVFSR